ncbi:phytoene/squalene synthase family protein [Lysobacter sp. F6437]|uniref:phytoene/squalene synthase family protein n=1 Tax=Lysobacter sp. F6437 TaxID=3459296 RepID=UPI00403DA57C
MGADDAAAPATARPDAGGDALASFIEKWRARWPEWRVAEVFIPAAQRETALAWAALQQELTDAAWGGSDPRPGEAKLAWWQEELAGWGRGARRHPLGAVLQRRPAAWATLAASLPSLLASRERPGSVEEAFAAVAPFAEAVARIDAGLFADSTGGKAEAVDSVEVRLVAAGLLQSRLGQTDALADIHAAAAGVPLAVLARAGDADPLPIWAGQLRRQWPSSRPASRPRRIWAALAHDRLGQADPTQPRASWKALLVAWRAARG